jgi:2-phospho-L-lactate guanylyltransferase
MRVLAVPVKRLERAKSRLAGLLSAPERAALTLAMLEDVLDACLAQEGWEVWVVSGADRALRAAAARGARPVREEGRSLLAAVRQVESLVEGPGPELAVVLADLPEITAPALGAVLARPSAVVAVASASDGGTNVLVRRPPRAIPARFGRSSFAKHRWAARRAGVSFEAVAAPELSFDLDRPGDLARVIAADRPTRTRLACRDMALADRLRLRA